MFPCHHQRRIRVLGLVTDLSQDTSLCCSDAAEEQAVFGRQQMRCAYEVYITCLTSAGLRCWQWERLTADSAVQMIPAHPQYYACRNPYPLQAIHLRIQLGVQLWPALLRLLTKPRRVHQQPTHLRECPVKPATLRTVLPPDPEFPRQHQVSR